MQCWFFYRFCMWCATVVCMNTAKLNKHRWLKPSLILSLRVTFTTPLPHILCYSALDVSSRAVCAKDDRHGWTGGKCRQLFAACSGEFLPNRLINPDEYDEDLELFSNFS